MNKSLLEVLKKKLDKFRGRKLSAVELKKVEKVVNKVLGEFSEKETNVVVDVTQNSKDLNKFDITIDLI